MKNALTAGQRALLQSALEQRRTALEQQIAQQFDGQSRTEHAREILLQDGDDATARDADREVDLARSDQELGEMRAISDALKRLETGQYGRNASASPLKSVAQISESGKSAKKTNVASTNGPRPCFSARCATGI